MFIVKKRSEVVRFGLFLLAVGLMAYFVASRIQAWRVSQGDPVHGVPVTNPILQGSQAQGPIEQVQEAPAGSDFFAEYRMKRQQSRSALQETLKEVMDSASVEADKKREASQQYLDSSRIAMMEDQAETLVKAKGFEDVVVFVSPSSAQVVVKAEHFDQQQALQIVDIVSNVTGIKNSGIQVIPKR